VLFGLFPVFRVVLAFNQTFPNGAAEKTTQNNKPSLAAQWEKSYQLSYLFCDRVDTDIRVFAVV